MARLERAFFHPMQKIGFAEALDSIVRSDPRYHRDAYVFLRDALDFTTKQQKIAKGTSIRHVSGPELLEGLRQYALKEFGPMVMRRTVIASLSNTTALETRSGDKDTDELVATRFGVIDCAVVMTGLSTKVAMNIRTTASLMLMNRMPISVCMTNALLVFIRESLNRIFVTSVIRLTPT
jgi:hypothetical protein